MYYSINSKSASWYILHDSSLEYYDRVQQLTHTTKYGDIKHVGRWNILHLGRYRIFVIAKEGKLHSETTSQIQGFSVGLEGDRTQLASFSVLCIRLDTLLPS